MTVQEYSLMQLVILVPKKNVSPLLEERNYSKIVIYTCIDLVVWWEHSNLYQFNKNYHSERDCLFWRGFPVADLHVGEGLGPPLFWVKKKKKITEEKHPPPHLAQGLNLPLIFWQHVFLHDYRLMKNYYPDLVRYLVQGFQLFW